LKGGRDFLSADGFFGGRMTRGADRFSKNRFSLFRITALSITAVLLILVGTLQYRWNSQIKKSGEISMGAQLESVMIRWQLDFYGEFSTVCVALQIGPDSGERDSWQDYLHRYATWSHATNNNDHVENLYVNRDLVKDIFIWETSQSPDPRLFRLNAEKETIDTAAVLPEMWALLDHLRKNSSSLPIALRAWAADNSRSERYWESKAQASPSHLLRSNSETGWQFDEKLPALVHPIFHYIRHGEVDRGHLRGIDPIDWVVVLLDLDTIKKRILPELMQRYFSSDQGLEYKLAVTSEGNTPSVLYSSEPGFGDQNIPTSDSVMNIFGPPPESTEGHLWQAEKNRVAIKGEDWHRFSGPVWFPIIQETSDGAPWVLVLQHRSGPLDAAVTKVWRSNLVMGGLTLVLLSATMVLVIIASHHAQRLASLQMGFVASISHELHTPLTVILSAGENLTDGFVDNREGLIQHGSIIKGQARRLKDLVDQILLFASIGSSKRRYVLQPISVSQLVRCACEHATILTAGAPFQIEAGYEENLPSVMGDLPALSQCLQNLVANAIKYCGSNRWIAIRANIQELGGYETEVRISIQDRGLGIDSAELPHVFEPFFRGREVAAMQIRGTGLGLALAKHIAEEMGGDLSVVSELHVGSTFTLHLPVLRESDVGGEPVTTSERGDVQ
jgi:signal transduction histidine kinase